MKEPSASSRAPRAVPAASITAPSWRRPVTKSWRSPSDSAVDPSSASVRAWIPCLRTTGAKTPAPSGSPASPTQANVGAGSGSSGPASAKAAAAAAIATTIGSAHFIAASVLRADRLPADAERLAR
jgi:hypothetical protein